MKKSVGQTSAGYVIGGVCLAIVLLIAAVALLVGGYLPVNKLNQNLQDTSCFVDSKRIINGCTGCPENSAYSVKIYVHYSLQDDTVLNSSIIQGYNSYDSAMSSLAHFSPNTEITCYYQKDNQRTVLLSLHDTLSFLISSIALFVLIVVIIVVLLFYYLIVWRKLIKESESAA